MNLIKKRIAKLLDIDEKDFVVVEGTENQYIITTKDYKNYVYSQNEDTIIDFQSLSKKDFTSNKYLTEEEKNEYFLNNQGLIGFALKRINIIDGIEKEELEDVCVFGFAKALTTFNKNEGIKFSTYCVRCMINEMYYYLRKEQKKLMKNTSFDRELTNEKDGTSIKVGDLIDSKVIGGKTVEENVMNTELYKILMNVISELDTDEQFLIMYRYGINKGNEVWTQAHIAEQLNMSQANISKMEKACLKKMRILMKRNHYIYNAKKKQLEEDSAIYFDMGAEDNYNYLDRYDENNIMLIAAMRLRIEIDEVKDIQPTDNKNEYKVTFNSNDRIYAIVNNVTNHAEVKKFNLSSEERFMEHILDIPNLIIPTREDIEETKYNIHYNRNVLKKNLIKLSQDEMYVLLHLYGILGTKQKLTSDIAKDLKKSVKEIDKLRISGMKKLREEYKKDARNN